MIEMEGGGGRGLEMRDIQHQHQQDQDQRGRKPQQQGNQQQQQQPPPPPPSAQPQKCPRCDSLNTKFCYYNNYSLAQPRYFCKTCRRYWTQGGTLRNVPVGGGCRKGKRLKRSSSPSSPSVDNFNSSTLSTSTNSIPPSNKGISISSSMAQIPTGGGVGGAPPPSMYYPSGGFLSSLAAFQSFNQGEFGGGGSNLGLLQGFSFPFQTQQQMNQYHQQQQQQQQLHQQQQQDHQTQHQMYLHESHNLNMGISDDIEEKVGPSTSHQEWSLGSPNPPEAVDYWSNNNNNTAATIINTSTTTSNHLGVSLNPTHWTDHLSGYGGPPPPPAPPPPPSTTTTPTSSSSPSFL